MARPTSQSLLMHHVTTHWPDAIMSAYDPTEAGHLPDEFSGAGNDIVLLGSALGERTGSDGAKAICKDTRVSSRGLFRRPRDDEGAMKKIGANAFFIRDTIRHDALIVRFSDILLRNEIVCHRRVRLFVGDVCTRV